MNDAASTLYIMHHNGTSLTVRAILLSCTRDSKVDRWRSVHRRVIKARDTALIVTLHIRVLLDPTGQIRKKIYATIVEHRTYLALK